MEHGSPPPRAGTSHRLQVEAFQGYVIAGPAGRPGCLRFFKGRIQEIPYGVFRADPDHRLHVRDGWSKALLMKSLPCCVLIAIWYP